MERDILKSGEFIIEGKEDREKRACSLGSSDFYERAKELFSRIMKILPPRISLSIENACRQRRDFPLGLSEIRIRRFGISGVVISGETLPIRASLSAEESDQLFQRLIGSSLYSYRDTISEGYVPFSCGIRVGIAGTAAYESGRMIGVSAPSSFVFRMPTVPYVDVSDLKNRLFSGGGMLIFSPPGCGKTTLIRSIARELGNWGKRCVVVDERCEFVSEDYLEGTVDILRGYKKAKGISIAARTLGAERIIVDEIGEEEDINALSSLCGRGVPIIATVHARNITDIKSQYGVMRLLEEGAFETLVGIEERSFKRTVYSVNEYFEKAEASEVTL